jgi:hypothetical protein
MEKTLPNMPNDLVIENKEYTQREQTCTARALHALDYFIRA